MSAPLLDVRSEVADALQAGRAVVALETTLITHGLPWPANLETARAADAAIRAAGAVPATVAVWRGRPTVGLTDAEVEALAGGREPARKAGRRDLGPAIAAGRTAATTVSGTMAIAHLAGVAVFATGGIGGVHRGAERSFDVSADLTELARTPVLVVCAGAKNVLDLAKTLEVLETLSVPVLGWRTERFPAFYVADSGLPVSARVESVTEAALAFRQHRALGGAGAVLARPPRSEESLAEGEFAAALAEAERLAESAGVSGPAVTPFLLARLAELTGGRTLEPNRRLVVGNATLAAEVAVALANLGG
jgi:pseudouridine-5'-phosphate glycosidase